MKAPPDSCSLRRGEIQGWPTVTLANSLIEVTVLPRKGADIYSFVDVASGVDVLFKTPWGLQPPSSTPRAGSGDCAFLQNYEGAWQELFPNTFLPCVYEDKDVPLHGEVATLPWDLAVEHESAESAAISLSVTCRQMPLALTRRMSISRHSPVLTIAEEVRNQSARQVQFVWGHHAALGAPFLEAGCRMEAAPCVITTPHEPFEPATASLAPSQRSSWPHVRRSDGGEADLREIGGPAANTHDHAYLTNFRAGWVEVENPRLDLAFRLEWDPAVFRWLVNWRPLGGSHTPPLDGIYAMALEPWATESNLAAAIAAGDALVIEGGGVLSTQLRASLHNPRSRSSK